MIKKATLLNLPEIFSLSKELYLDSINHRSLYIWDDEKALLALQQFITDENSIILIDYNAEGLKGYIIAELNSPIAGHSVIASVVALYVKPKYRGGTTFLRLIKFFESWAREKNATFFELGVSSGVNHDKTLSYYSALGYRPSSVSYIKEI